jgi:asparagine synthase (glutamine-hydrolysing)
MCGIFGHFDPRGGDLALVERMAQRLAHRGPDGYGTYHTGALAFGAGRLAIIDLTAPAGPIFNEDRTVSVVYNGEIYNFRDLRRTLEAAGHTFATGTDTEVVVHGYEEWGDDVIARLRGMFALCIYDSHRERLLLARDRLGEKPLYYAEHDGAFFFASEIKGILEHASFPRAVNREALVSFALLGYAAPPHTMFEGVRKLAAGERLVVERHGDRLSSHVERYWTPVMDTSRAPAASYADLVQQVRDLVFAAVEMRLMSDVPLGVFLSGGLDSTAIAAIVAGAMGHPVQSFTVGFEMSPGSRGDAKFNVDTRFAREAAAFLHTEHHEIRVQDQALTDLFPYLVYAMDEPVAQPAIIQTAHVAALARKSGVPVLLSGDASDEMFAGYPAYRADRVLERYLQIPALLRESVLSPLFARVPLGRVRNLAHKSRETDPVRRYMHWKRMFDLDHLPDVLADDRLADQRETIIDRIIRPLITAPHTDRFADRIAFTSLNLWIPEDSNMRVDKMTMAMSVEARAPFEDHLLAELALHIPLRYKLRQGDVKRVLKDAVRDLVPESVLTRSKWGFVPPSSDWLRTVLRPHVDRYLSREYVEAAGMFNPETVARLVDNHMTKRSYELWTVWPLLVFHLWHALYIDGSLTLDQRLTPDAIAGL